MSALSAVEEKMVRCMKCGLCRAACPIYKETGVESNLARGRVRLVKAVLRRELPITPNLVSKIYMCLLCRQCVTACPSGVDVDTIMKAAREEFAQGGFAPGAMETLAKSIDEFKNITGEANESRRLWTEGESWAERVAAQAQGAEALYFVGCVAALFPQVYDIPRAVASLLDSGGVRFATAQGDEWCCGFPLLVGGMPGRARQLARRNVAAVRETGVKALVAACPSCYHTWKTGYPELLGEDLGFKVLHSSEALLELVESGRLKPAAVEMTVTYHDPCDLGRKSGVYDPPRNLLKSIPGIDLVEMKATRDATVCCGGGGNMEMNFPDMVQALAKKKVQEVLSTGASVVATSCQQCKRTIQGSARKDKAKLRVLDVSEILARAVSG
ncbi:MAG: (Fe-S)-binding protein [Firmicutes bacterium]|nr:(Fe-S)-binding protein [Bacillota bacterium]